MSENLTKKERKELAKTLKTSSQQKNKLGGLVFTSVIVLIIVGAIVGIYLLSSSKKTREDIGEKVAIDPKTGQLHINVGEEHVPYSSNPPTSGPHYNTPGYGPIECKAYNEEIKDEGAIHNLEHGGIWISYQDKNDTTLKAELAKFAEENSKVVVSPRSKNDAKIAVVAWGRLLKLEALDKGKIQNFIELYKNAPGVPEPLAGCGV